MIYTNYLVGFYEKFPRYFKNSFSYEELKNYLFFGKELHIDLQDVIDHRKEGWLDATAIKCCRDNILEYDIADEEEMTVWANERALLLISAFTLEQFQALWVGIKTDGKLN